MAASVESSKQIDFGTAGKTDTQALPADEEDDFRRAEESSEDATDNEKSAVSSADESGTKSEADEDIEQKKENTTTKIIGNKEKPRGNGELIFPLDTNAAEVVKSDGLRRERKQVERFAHIPIKHEERPIIIANGSGVKLNEIEYISSQINKRKPADLASLHRLFFDRRGTQTQIKKNIRLFSGFSFDDKSFEYAKKKKQMEKWSSKVVREICDVLGVPKRVSKDQSIEGVLEFCLQPSDRGKKMISKTPKKKTSSSKSKKSPSKPKKTTDSQKSETISAKKEKGLKRKLPSSGSGSDQDEVTGNSGGKSKSKEPPSKKSREGSGRKASEGKMYAEDAYEEMEKMSDSESDFKTDEEKPTKKKIKKTVKPKPLAKKSSTKKTPKSTKPPDSDSGNDESESTKIPPKIPTEEDLKKSVQRIIETSDLKKVSMRMVLDRVFGEYPGVDLQDKKALIKSQVQEMLSSS